LTGAQLKLKACVLDPDELSAWLRLIETPKVGRESARRLLAAFGSPQAVFAASESMLSMVVGKSQSRALLLPPVNLHALCEATSRWLDEMPTRHIFTLGSVHYPPLLLASNDPPLMLYAQGCVALLAAPSISMVGSRNPTRQGSDNAHAFAESFSQLGYTVVSGLALGVDGAAHEGALKGPSATIAVVGTGLDRVYPKSHLKLAHQIAEEGLMLSEYPLGTPPIAQNFPVRNRIIAGLSLGTLVIEATLQSGSLITARLASECGREVFAVPGSIHAPQSKGCHALIRQGAKLVETAQDVIQELLPMLDHAPTIAGVKNQAAFSDAGVAETTSSLNDPVLDALGFDPVTLDALIARTGWPAQTLNIRLLELELSGDVARLPGQLFQRTGCA
jgi:DNA processing protein